MVGGTVVTGAVVVEVVVGGAVVTGIVVVEVVVGGVVVVEVVVGGAVVIGVGSTCAIDPGGESDVIVSLGVSVVTTDFSPQANMEKVIERVKTIVNKIAITFFGILRSVCTKVNW